MFLRNEAKLCRPDRAQYLIGGPRTQGVAALCWAISLSSLQDSGRARYRKLPNEANLHRDEVWSPAFRRPGARPHMTLSNIPTRSGQSTPHRLKPGLHAKLPNEPIPWLGGQDEQDREDAGPEFLPNEPIFPCPALSRPTAQWEITDSCRSSLENYETNPSRTATRNGVPP